MIERLDMEAPQVLGYRIAGEMTTDDIGSLHEDILATLEEQGSVRLLLDVRDFESAEPSAVVKDLKLTPEYVRDVERYAIVGNRRWQEWMTGATDLATRGEARYFEPEQFDRAREWIRE